MTRILRLIASRRMAVAIAATCGVFGIGLFAADQQKPTFRAGTDVIAVDVQVVDGSGAPILGLGPDKFEVSINRKRRTVVSASLLRFDEIQGSPVVQRFESPGAARTRVSLPPASDQPDEGRIYVLAVDTMSFRPAATVNLMAAARAFVETLQPNDIVGVFPFPLDGSTDLTTDHAAVLKALEKVIGTRMAHGGDCYLNPSDIADFTSPRAPDPMTPNPDPLIVRRVAEIAATSSGICRPIQEAKISAMMEEVEIAQRLGSLRGMLDALAGNPRRKTVVLISTGIVTTDRPGGRPDVGVDLGAIVGQDAARANATIYTLWVDTRDSGTAAARPGGARSLDNPERDARLLSAPLERITAASGGTMFNVIQGGGEFAFDRILKETSAYYLLGVEPESADRDGRPRELTVKIKDLPRGASVRARSWVVVPKLSAPPRAPQAEQVAVSTPAEPSNAPAAPPAPRSRLTVAEGARRAVAAPAARVVPPPDPTLEPVLTNAGTYVRRLVDAFVNLVAEERYTQDIVTGGSLLSDGPRTTIGPTHRELRSDFLLVKTGGPLDWVSFRDVFEVDGTPVRERDERLAKLFTQPASTAIEQAVRITREGARFNIGAVDRTINTPLLPLFFLQPEIQSRFRFTRGTRTPEFSDAVLVIDYQEIAQPTVIRTVRDTDRPAAGRFWIDPATGRVLQAELVLSGNGVEVKFTTLFQSDERLGISVPVRMREEYALPSGRLTGLATYQGFRRFDVNTETNVTEPR